MIRTGIFGGTFNPVHQGHTGLAHRLISDGLFDEIWLNLSPANPLKESRPGATDADRREMLSLACERREGIRPCFVEFSMPRPSYTIDTLQRLRSYYPDRQFKLIIGADNWQIFNKWRSPEKIITDFGVTIYPRPGYEVNPPLPDGVTYLAGSPVCDISSSEIRAGHHQDLLDPKVQEYISLHNLYADSKTVK